jgi:hypothetical protein
MTLRNAGVKFHFRPAILVLSVDHLYFIRNYFWLVRAELIAPCLFLLLLQVFVLLLSQDNSRL